MPGTLSRRTFLANAAAVPAATLVPTGVATLARPTVTTARLIEAERSVIRSAMEGSGIGAAAVCLVEDGQVRWIEGFGHASGQGSVPVDASTMFSIQSTSKNFAAVAVLLAVQDGILDLDAPITRYLPSFTLRSRFEHSRRSASPCACCLPTALDSRTRRHWATTTNRRHRVLMRTSAASRRHGCAFR